MTAAIGGQAAHITIWRRSERLANRELEALGLISPVVPQRIAAPGVERHAEAEPEEPERRQPLHRDAGRALEVAPAVQVIGLRRHPVRPDELDPVAGIEDVADVEEEAHPGVLPPL